MIDVRNYEITQKIATSLELFKGFDVAYGNPDKGVMIVRYDKYHYTPEIDHKIDAFKVTIEPLYNTIDDTPQDFNQVVEENKFWWRQVR